VGEWEAGRSYPKTKHFKKLIALAVEHQAFAPSSEAREIRALSILEQELGSDHPFTVHPLHGLAQLFQDQGKDEQAEALYQRALTIREKRLGPYHPETEESHKAYAAFLCLARVGKECHEH
jgi:hypothetical protein